jgi:nitroreductase
MDLVTAILTRHSTRDFKSDPISKDTVMKIIETAVHVPSAINSQPWNIYAAAGPAIEKIRQAYIERHEKGVMGKGEVSGTPLNQMPRSVLERFDEMRAARMKLIGLKPEDPSSGKVMALQGARLYNAPVLLVITMDKVMDKMSLFDLGMLSQNILLCAQNFGLGSIVAASVAGHPDVLRAELDIPDTQVIAIGICLGYINTSSKINTYVSGRRPLSETVTYKGF